MNALSISDFLFILGMLLLGVYASKKLSPQRIILLPREIFLSI